MRIKLFTHIDLDGIGCAILAFSCFGKGNVDVEYCDYKDINQKVVDFLPDSKKYDGVFITDISVSEEVAQKVTALNHNCFLLYDHHGTALNLNKYSWCRVDVEDNETGVKTSGTELFFKYVIKEVMKTLKTVKQYDGYNEEAYCNFVEVVRNYDTWLWSTMGEEGLVCKQINDLLFLYGRQNFIDWSLQKLYANNFPNLSDTDKQVLLIRQNEIDDYIKQKDKEMFIREFNDKNYGVVVADRFTSELGNALCKLHPEIDFVALINISSGTVSYRTVKDNINLGTDVAKVFGGGGHPKAAGSKFDASSVRELVTEYILGGESLY